ncbi:cyclic pyranopterin monophosphate synthase MoaC [Arcticibacter sp. MXS-1]|uniref:cyclic pyranopterin monophosphate synthase MoaC n=1 Tax=Arcticibacter sp. MXS-1 TaxID=3341726 RepID=UPI0035A9100A
MNHDSGHLSHVNPATGHAAMVDVSGKQVSRRTATARTVVTPGFQIAEILKNDEIHTKKGPVFQTAIIAGVMAAKRTAELIPLCHPLPLEDCQIEIVVNDKNEIVITCEVVITAKTGVEMEALTGASVAALTIYDMCKALSHGIVIRETKLISKTGGKHDYKSAEA